MERTATGKDKGKTGVFTGAYAVHPLTGEKVPIWIADFVLNSYGTGCVMSVPAHDERDFEFAKKFGLNIKQVIRADKGETELPYVDAGVVCNSGDALDGLTVEQAKKAVTDALQKQGLARKRSLTSYATGFFPSKILGRAYPIYFPVDMHEEGSPIDGASHTIDYTTAIPVDDADLPLKLPEMSDFKPGEDPAGCLARAKEALLSKGWQVVRSRNQHNASVGWQLLVLPKIC